jgi:hypothetical protein
MAGRFRVPSSKELPEMRRISSFSGRLVACAAAAALCAIFPQASTKAQEQAPAGRAVGRGLGEGRGGGPTMAPSALRTGGDESSRDRAVNQETFPGNEFGVRTFGYTSFVVDPSSGQMPAIAPAAAARRKAMANAGTFDEGPFNTFEDFRLYDRGRALSRGTIT